MNKIKFYKIDPPNTRTPAQTNRTNKPYYQQPCVPTVSGKQASSSSAVRTNARREDEPFLPTVRVGVKVGVRVRVRGTNQRHARDEPFLPTVRVGVRVRVRVRVIG